MHAYAPTFLANHGGGLLIAALGMASLGPLVRHRRWFAAIVIGSSSVLLLVLLGPFLQALVLHSPMPASDGALATAEGVPLVTMGLLALGLRRPAHARSWHLDLASLAPLALGLRGVPGVVTAMGLIGGGWMAAGRARDALLTSVFVLVTATALHANRLACQDSVASWLNSSDLAVQAVDLFITVLEVGGLVIATLTMLQPFER